MTSREYKYHYLVVPYISFVFGIKNITKPFLYKRTKHDKRTSKIKKQTELQEQ